ncbi:hypothetical protein [Psychromicrobium sp. YIM B11713]|uniref:hypothetical protein n=1 Tax=Psychromicrobium sp. YIM B11713 TaxID=3145233 RepID=UPI00374F0D85
MKHAIALRLTALLCGSSLALLLGACATPSNPAASGPAQTHSTNAPAPSVAETSLTVVVQADPASASSTSTLKCDGGAALSGSTVSDPGKACAALEASGKSVFENVSTPQSCTLQSGGPQTAKVTGVFKGSAVNKTFDQHDGCAIAEWKLLAPLFGDIGSNTR